MSTQSASFSNTKIGKQKLNNMLIKKMLASYWLINLAFLALRIFEIG